MSSQLKSDIRYVKGVGPKKGELLNRLGISTLEEMLLYFPRRYEDRTHFKPIARVQPGDFLTLQGKVLNAANVRAGRVNLFEVTFTDGTGVLKAVWFNQPFLKKVFRPGQEVVLSGKVEDYHGLQLKTPEYELIDADTERTLHTGRIVPIYPLREGVSQKFLRRLLYTIWEHLGSPFHEYLPEEILTAYCFLNIQETLRQIHFPDSFQALERARRRIVYEEFLLFQMDFALQVKKRDEASNVFVLKEDADIRKAFTASLPFSLTTDQERVIGEIFQDMAGRHSMNRLIEGDVGSGKTLVACSAMLAAVRSGWQAAFLIPTEVLAEQHLHTLKRFLGPFDLSVEYLIGGAKKKQRQEILDRLHSGEVDILIGTHAILQDDVAFKNLGLVVIDEQHKFGVRQRARLLEVPNRPHLLVMTATPIPRTLGLALFGDLEISVIRTLPKGRKPIRTYFVSRAKVPDMFDFLRKRITAGDQVYILFPLVEETEKTDLKAATEEYKRLKETEFRDVSVGLIHGRLKKAEKDVIMDAFRAGKIQVLCATSVVEVGVDNPNATCILIEHAERFGLSQLHQLRGRVGRGEKQSFCFLLGQPKTEEAKKRMQIMTTMQDGFVISEEDLKLRGPGDFLGTRQSGMPEFLLANVLEDQEILRQARQDAFRFTASHTGSALRDHLFFRKVQREKAYVNN